MRIFLPLSKNEAAEVAAFGDFRKFFLHIGGVDDDFSFALAGLGRFRVNIFRQRGSLAAVIRVIRFGIPDPAKLGIPESVLSLADNKKGLVLITGSAGTGKSTTLACMIDRINETRSCHIITLEDRMSTVRYQLESMESQLRTYDNMVDYSTVHMNIQEVKELTPVIEEEETAWERFVNGFKESLKDSLIQKIEVFPLKDLPDEIGRASCRERV